jgi:hypothetical protein
MKRIFFIAATFYFSTLSFGQNNYDLGRVKKVNGVEAYVMCEPLREYEVLVDVGTGAKAESIITGGLVNKNISSRIEQFIKRVKKENESIEAIVYTSGKRVVGVKFKDSATLENKGIARASKMKGRLLFVLCEPLNNYDVLKSKGGGIKWKSAITGGIVNNSIEEDVEKIVNKLDNVKGVDAFYFDGTKEGDAIGFVKK